jgi:hypothetical protein
MEIHPLAQALIMMVISVKYTLGEEHLTRLRSLGGPPVIQFLLKYLGVIT